MPRSAVGPLIASVALIAIACTSGGEPQPTATPETEATATPESTLPPSPTATIKPAPLPTLAPTDGTLVYLRGTDLWVASLDGESVPPRAITTDSINAGYAGYVRREDGGIDLYYLSQLTEKRGPPDIRSVADFGLYRVPLAGGTPEELLRFTSRTSSASAAVSPDGEHLVYADDVGLALFQRASGERTRLIEHETCAVDPEPYGRGCFDYRNPLWLPGRDVIMVRQLLYEFAFLVLFNPFESPIDATVITTGTGTGRWTTDGERMCTWTSYGLGDALIRVEHAATGETIDIFAKLPLPEPGPSTYQNANGCAWSNDGRLAAGYTEDLDIPGRIAIFDNAYAIGEESDPIMDLSRVIAWLPDGSGMIFNRAPRIESWRSLRSFPPGVFDLERGIVDLPFEADQVLDVIP